MLMNQKPRTAGRKLTESHRQALRLIAERIVDRHVQRQQNIAERVAEAKNGKENPTP